MNNFWQNMLEFGLPIFISMSLGFALIRPSTFPVGRRARRIEKVHKAKNHDFF